MNGLLGTTCYDSIVSARVVLGDSNVVRRLQDLPSSTTCSRNRPLVTQHDLIVSDMGISQQLSGWHSSFPRCSFFGRHLTSV